MHSKKETKTNELFECERYKYKKMSRTSENASDEGMCVHKCFSKSKSGNKKELQGGKEKEGQIEEKHKSEKPESVVLFVNWSGKSHM